MATESSKKLASEKEIISSQVQVDTNGQHAFGHFFHLPQSRRNKSIIIVAIITLFIVALIVFAIRSPHAGQKVYAQAAGHKVYKSDVENLIQTTQGANVHQGATVLANKYLTEAMAKKADIKVTDSDVTAKFGSMVVEQKNSNKYVYQSDLNSVYFDKLAAYNTGLYQGQLIVANFSRHIAFQSPFLGIQKASDPLMGNTQAIAQDRQYADNFISNLYSQIKSHQITFDQAIQKEHDDPQLGTQAYQTLPHSGPFNTSNVFLPATTLILPDSIRSRVHNMKAGQISTSFVVSVNNSLTKKNIKTDSYYLIVKMDSTKGGNSNMTYVQYLAESKQKLGYKVYV